MHIYVERDDSEYLVRNDSGSLLFSPLRVVVVVYFAAREESRARASTVTSRAGSRGGSGGGRRGGARRAKAGARARERARADGVRAIAARERLARAAGAPKVIRARADAPAEALRRGVSLLSIRDDGRGARRCSSARMKTWSTCLLD